MIPDDLAAQLPDSEGEWQLRGGASRDPASRRGPAYERVRARMQANGSLTFADFMDEALYGPHGYYTCRPRLGGATADFFTSPELHPAFGGLMGRLAAAVWEQLGRPDRFDIVEHGPGTGALCRDLLTSADHEWPVFGRSIRYQLVESSPALQMLQHETLVSTGIADGRVSWYDPSATMRPRPRSSGTRPATGLILVNELVDALPVHLVAMRDGVLCERYVVLDEAGELGWQEDEPSTPALAAYFERLGVWPGEGCVAEVNLNGVEWMEQTAGSLERGALLVLDYGYPAPDLYAPTRRFGTLLTYRAHALGSDPLVHVGEQDITAHVDFTSLARAGERGGLRTVGLISQAALLRQLGLERLLRQLERAPLTASEYDANRRALQALVDPDGLGKVQALLQTRGLPNFDPFSAASRSSGASGDPSWIPLLRPGQMRLPGPLEAEGFVDLDAQWREQFGESDEVDDTD